MRNASKLLFVLLIALSLISCSRGAGTQKEAEAVVRKMYSALASGDRDAYMDTILPENRRVFNPVNLVPALSIGANFGVLGIGLDMDQLTQLSIKDLTVQTIRTSPGYALVEARGTVRYPGIGMEFNFCDQHDVREQDGHWYVDIYAPERQERVTRLLEKRQRELLENPSTTGTANDPFSLILSGIGQGMEQALNLCGE